ncbi:MAG: type II secretion system F family protein [Candidatus Micrarchaeia archaeon]
MAEDTNNVTGINNSQDSTKPVAFTKSKKFLFFKIKSKPIYDDKKGNNKNTKLQQNNNVNVAGPITNQSKNISNINMNQTNSDFSSTSTNKQNATPQDTSADQSKNKSKMNKKIKAQSTYITRIIISKKGLDSALRDIGIKSSAYDFIKRMMMFSILLAIVTSILVFAILYKLNVSPLASIIIALVTLIAMYNIFFNNFINYPITRGRKLGKEIDKDILFATRDMVIGMRSGMPLFNAITSISTGYGWASVEFGKIVSLVQLGMPIEQAIDEISEKSYSKIFKRIMLQASISIKVGADITTSLQSVIDDIMQERVIELRRYGQRLNALAMFYMIFGVIFPSMGIAVAAIMTTFISLITINTTTLIMVLVFIVGIQIIFLNMIKSSRPSFSM